MHRLIHSHSVFRPLEQFARSRSTRYRHPARGPRGPIAYCRSFCRVILGKTPSRARVKDRRRRYQLLLAALVQRSRAVRVALHLVGIVRKPRNFRWHWRCIIREFHDRKP